MTGVGLTKAFLHASQRCEQRYGVRWEGVEQYLADCKMLASRKGGVNRTATDQGYLEAWIQVRDVWVCVAYRHDTRLIHTVLPAPQAPIPGAKELAEAIERFEAAQKRAHDLKQTVNQQRYEITRLEAELSALRQHLKATRHERNRNGGIW